MLYEILLLTINLVDVILKAVGRATTHIDAMDEVSITLEFTPDEDAKSRQPMWAEDGL